MKSILRKIVTIVEIIIVGVCVLIALSTVTYKNSGKGIGIASNNKYNTIITSFGDNINTFLVKGEIPEPSEINITKHRNQSLYYELTDDEKIVYDTVLTRANQIMKEGISDTEVHVPLATMKIDMSNKSYDEVKEEINERVSGIDYRKVYKALHRDYEYLMWWEYDMLWEWTEADIIINNNSLDNSSFQLTLSPAECFRADTNTIKEESLTKARNAYSVAEAIVNNNEEEDIVKILTSYKNWIINNVGYNDTVVEKMFANSAEEDVVLARNFINVFDEDNATDVICGGYSNAFQLLCDLSGLDITCLKAEGEMITPNKNLEHAWNIVVINDKEYLVDITNTDTGTVGQKGQLFLKEVNRDGSYNIKFPSGTIYTYYEEN